MINENSSYVSNKNDSSKKGFPSFNTTVSSHYPKVRPQYNKML